MRKTPSESGLPAYRWVVVAASSLILAVSMGAIVNGMQKTFGWDRGEIALINVAGIVGLAIGGLIMGAQADRRGTRPVVLFGILVLGLCYLAAGLADALWQYYALMFVAGFFGAAAIFPPIMAAIGNWFVVGAGLAIGIASRASASTGRWPSPAASSWSCCSPSRYCSSRRRRSRWTARRPRRWLRKPIRPSASSFPR